MSDLNSVIKKKKYGCKVLKYVLSGPSQKTFADYISFLFSNKLPQTWWQNGVNESYYRTFKAEGQVSQMALTGLQSRPLKLHSLLQAIGQISILDFSESF